MKNTDFDVIVYGATGFTGKLVAEYLSQRKSAVPLRWAMAGRDHAKLVKVRDEIGASEDTTLLIADSSDADALQRIARRARSIISTVGPYQLFGDAVVAACVAEGTDYLDLCGEVAWLRRMIDTYDEQAKASGARILFSCGFDSIPFELGVLFAQNAMIARHGSPAPRVKGGVVGFKGGFSGGTVASLKANESAIGADPTLLAILQDPFALTPGFRGPPQPDDDGGATFDDGLGCWTAPFVMAQINTRNVHRSNLLQAFPYGTDFVYDERILTGPGEPGRAAAEGLARMGSLSADPTAPKPGEGPSLEEREAGFFELLFVAVDGSGNVGVSATVKGRGDPGYASTSKMIAETAACLCATEQAIAGGCWTPGAALGNVLIAHLTETAGLSFDIAG